MTTNPVASCPQCGTELAPTLLACPRCGRLIQTERLEELARIAREATGRGDASAAMAAWREALDLLPKNSKQHQVISAKITELGQNIDPTVIPAEPEKGSKSPGLRVATGVGALGLMLWKIKAVFLGLTKGTTFLTMLLSLGVYWTMWGWKFALGLVLSIYVHEMGHVIALRKYGVKAGAPMFIPGIGALVRLRQQIVNPDEDAEIGLAGPIYGLIAALIALSLWLTTKHLVFAAIASVGASINLLNLIPIAPLDGGRGFHALSRPQKILATATVACAWYYTQDGMLTLVGIICFVRAIGDRPSSHQNWKATLTYCLLIIALTAIAAVNSQIPPMNK